MSRHCHAFVLDHIPQLQRLHIKPQALNATFQTLNACIVLNIGTNTA